MKRTAETQNAGTQSHKNTFYIQYVPETNIHNMLVYPYGVCT